MVDPAERPFSLAWTVASIVLFLAVELILGTWLGPLVIGKYVSPMFHYQLQMMMHLLSFFLGGMAVGVISPGRRLVEPAVGAAISVVVVFLISVFMPTWYFHFDLTKVLLGGGIGFFLALLGAWQGEKFMGNLDPDDAEVRTTTRGKLRASLWAEGDGLFVQKKEHTRD